MRFIGDIHAKLYEYRNIISKTDGPSIQIGDFGYGFFGNRYQKYFNGVKNFGQHRFIRGNHDCPKLAKAQPNFIKDGSMYKNVFCMGGAWSFDHAKRTKGHNWWSDEELSYTELNTAIDVYDKNKPDVVCTHDCPSNVAYEMFIKRLNKPHFKTRTSDALEAMLEIHRPKLWIFGHWHKNMVQKINGTVFICVAELDYVDINLDTFKIKGGSTDIFKIHKNL